MPLSSDTRKRMVLLFALGVCGSCVQIAPIARKSALVGGPPPQGDRTSTQYQHEIFLSVRTHLATSPTAAATEPGGRVLAFSLNTAEKVLTQRNFSYATAGTSLTTEASLVHPVHDLLYVRLRPSDSVGHGDFETFRFDPSSDRFQLAPSELKLPSGSGGRLAALSADGLVWVSLSDNPRLWEGPPSAELRLVLLDPASGAPITQAPKRIALPDATFWIDGMTFEPGGSTLQIVGRKLLKVAGYGDYYFSNPKVLRYRLSAASAELVPIDSARELAVPSSCAGSVLTKSLCLILPIAFDGETSQHLFGAVIGGSWGEPRPEFVQTVDERDSADPTWTAAEVVPIENLPWGRLKQVTLDFFSHPSSEPRATYRDADGKLVRVRLRLDSLIKSLAETGALATSLRWDAFSGLLIAVAHTPSAEELLCFFLWNENHGGFELLARSKVSGLPPLATDFIRQETLRGLSLASYAQVPSEAFSVAPLGKASVALSVPEWKRARNLDVASPSP